MIEGLLGEIVAHARERLREARARRPAAALARAAEAAPPAKDLVAALRAEGRLNVIAEFKPASPSRGPLRPDADVRELARIYEQAGAAAMSVLTEPAWFGSGLDRLEAARASCGLPLLRKDFLLDPYHVDEARAAGADAALVIVGVAEGSALPDLIQAAEGRGMAALVEVHDEREIERALRSGARLIGINQRDLRDLSVDPGRAARLLPRLPAGTTAVAESGLSRRDDLERLRGAGCHAFLIGSHLMTADDPGRALEELCG